MRSSVAVARTRRRPAPRSASSRSATSSAVGARSQRPELWGLYNGRVRKGQHMRVFPISNWTEMDVWQYIQQEGLGGPGDLLRALFHVFKRNGMWLSTGLHLNPRDDEPIQKMVRYRTVGDMTCTGAVESSARTLDEIVIETAAGRITERGATRADDAFAKHRWKTGSARVTSRNGISKRCAPGSDGLFALLHRWLGRRRQEHPHWPPAVRLEGHLEDQLAAIEQTSKRRGNATVDLALLTDGLRAEREQGITIDVAYRYFATPRRKFIIADTPGHIQYTRNMVTGASTARPQSSSSTPAVAHRAVAPSRLHRRPAGHACTSSWPSTRWIWSTGARRSSSGSRASLRPCPAKLDVHDITFIPDQRPLRRQRRRALDQHALVWRPDAALSPRARGIAQADRNLIDNRFPVNT